MYLSAHPAALFLTELSRDELKNYYQSLFFFQNTCCIFAETRILEFYQNYMLNVASHVYNILERGKYSTLRPSLCISYTSHNYLTRK